MRTWMVTALLLAVAQPAAAQRRDLAVPADKGWQHAPTGVVLTATLAGLPRVGLTDSGTLERDVAAQFSEGKDETSLTVFIFKPALQSAPLWFDRAAAVLSRRDSYGGATPAAAPQAFARPGGSVASGLKQVFVPNRGPYRSTALAVVPLGEWLVAVRMSSVKLDPAGMAPALDEALAAIRWPKAAAEGPAAVPIADCADALKLERAKAKKADMTQTVLASALAGMMLDKSKGTPAPAAALCRDAASTPLFGVYRRAEQRDGYTLAIADSGRVAYVAPTLALPGLPADGGGYGVMYRDLDDTIATYPVFDRLPAAEQVATLALQGRPASRTRMQANGRPEVSIIAPPK